MLNIFEDRLIALPSSYRLDGRESTHPLDVRGYSAIQCYVLKESESALLIGTGLPGHQQRILESLREVLGSSAVSLLPLRLDFTAIANARAIADCFGVERVHQRYPYPPAGWLNVRPEFSLDDNQALEAATVSPALSGEAIAVDREGSRRLCLLSSPLRLLPAHWAYDETTSTLFSVDMFSWVGRPTSDGPWVITDDDDDPTTSDAIAHHLTGTRYWWLPNADTEGIRRGLAEIFDQRTIETIAPDFGCILHGPAVVGRHYQLLDDFLATAPRLPSIGVSVGTWPLSHRTP